MSKIKICRICKSNKLFNLFSLGTQSYTGIFPSKKKKIPKGKLTLIICKKCKLVQLDKNFNSKIMYGDNYGYRTGLNKSMYLHIKNKKIFLEKKIKLKKNDLIIDIGSNDGSFLNQFKKDNYKLIGIDPTIKKFGKYYKKGIVKIQNFFSYKNINLITKNPKAKLITSFAMFYDLKDPLKFSKDIYNCLDNNGIWHFEQSYLLEMIKKNSYDTICHEHLEYYSLTTIYYLMKLTNFKIIDITKNQINGGSIAITVAKKESRMKECTKILKSELLKEKELKLNTTNFYKKFYKKIIKNKSILIKMLTNIKKSGKNIIGYGASTKGNVILQYCNIKKNILEYIYDINEDKFNKFTPGTNIKILSKKETLKLKFDYFLVLPWHFKKYILKKEKNGSFKNKKFIFPLPEPEII
jgi:hypothetical protein